MAKKLSKKEIKRRFDSFIKAGDWVNPFRKKYGLK